MCLLLLLLLLLLLCLAACCTLTGPAECCASGAASATQARFGAPPPPDDSAICCPAGQCGGSRGCVPAEPIYACGPVQGQNCTGNFLCPTGPATWAADAPQAILVLGDSVSIGWTPRIELLLGADNHTVLHSPGALQDGGARSTSNMLQCSDYLLSTEELTPLPLRKDDVFLFNFGLHDYNYGLAGVPQYTEELTNITKQLVSLVHLHSTSLSLSLSLNI